MRKFSTRLLVSAVLGMCVFYAPAIAETPAVPGTSIVLVADVSNSMNTADRDKYLPEAVKLGIDLAPQDSRVGLVTFSDEPQYVSGLIDPEKAEQRNTLKTAAESMRYNGSTSFAAGVGQALELLAETPAAAGRVVLLADISEGGLYEKRRATEEETDAYIQRLRELGEQAASRRVTIDLFLVGEEPTGRSGADAVRELASKTGGRLVQLESSSQLPAEVERLYFDNYRYQQSVITGVNTAGGLQNFTIQLPTPFTDRARLYVSAAAPAEGIQVGYEGSGMETESNRSYCMADISRPEKREIAFSVRNGESGEVKVYLLTDYRLGSTAEAVSEWASSGEEDEPIQISILRIDLTNAVTGNSIITDELLRGFTGTVRLTPPEGAETQELPVTLQAGKMVGELRPASFGVYTVQCSLSSQDLTLEFPPVAVQIEELAPLPPPKDYTVVIASIAGGLIILAAIIAAVLLRMRRRKTYKTEIHSSYSFSGKLDVYIVLARAGEYEFPPFTFYLTSVVGEKKINLSQILRSGNVTLEFPGAEKIWFYVGERDSLLVKNASQGEILCAGDSIRTGGTRQITFGQKIHINLEEDVNEITIYYQNVKGAAGTRPGEALHYATRT